MEPHYPKAERAATGGPHDHAADLLLATVVQPSDPGMEESFYDSSALRRFAGVDLGVAAAPDETSILRFRHLLE